MRVGSASDPLEREADVAAALVVRRFRSAAAGAADPFPAMDAGTRVRRRDGAPSAARFGSGAGSPAGRTEVPPVDSRVRRRADGVTAAEPTTAVGSRIRRRSGSPAGEFDAPAGVTSHIESSRGSGEPLPPAIAAAMGDAFGADLGDVRIHADTRAARSAEAIDAKAFTTGNDVFFGHGEYRPDSSAGQQVLAHELAHVVQQGGATVQPLRRRNEEPRRG
jgi:hypothetical protein